MLELPATREAHAELLAEHSFLDDVEQGRGTAGRAPADLLRIVCWNAQRGRNPEAAARLLSEQRADVFLLSELDRGMARTSQLDTPREIARRLDCGHVFGVEFLELGLGDEQERAHHAGEQNEIGYHGGAILTAQPVERPALVRLERSGAWFDGERGERRVGGRIAVLATVVFGRSRLTVASVHLDSHGTPEERAAQLQVLLDAIETHAPEAPAVIGGDLNSFSLSYTQIRDRDVLRAALKEDPDRLTNPVRYEPLFDVAAAAGYHWRSCNEPGEGTQRHASGRGALKIDWFLCRGVETRAPCVIPALDDEGTPLSDHELIAIDVDLG